MTVTKRSFVTFIPAKPAISVLFLFLIATFFLTTQGGIPALGAMEETGNPKVLILNSYHQGYVWTDDEVNGLTTHFQKALPEADIYIEYMGTKWMDNPDYFPLLAEVYTKKFSRIQFDIIVATDNDAFSFLHKYRDEVFGKIPTVFCGVNYITPEDLQGFEMVTGINEWPDLAGNLDLILDLHDSTEKIVVVVDTSITGRRIYRQFMDIVPDYADRLEFEFLTDIEMDHLLQRVSTLPPQTVLLFTFFLKDKSGKIYDPDETTSLVSDASTVPIYGAWDFSMGHGIIGGRLISGIDQGYAAANLARQILQGKRIANLPIVMKKSSRPIFDYRQLQRFAIVLDDLPDDASILYGPSAAYVIDKRLAWAWILGSGSLFLVITTLLVNIFRRREAEIALRESEEQYRGLVDNINVGVFRTSKDGRFIRINPAMAKMFGYADTGELMQIAVMDLYQKEEDRQQLWKLVQQHGSVREMSIGMRKKDGTPIWASLMVSVNSHADTGELYLDGVIDDITERLAYQESLRLSEERYRALFQDNPSMYFTLDASGNVMDVNTYGSRRLGFHREELIGHSLFGIIHPSDREALKQQLSGCIDNPRQVMRWKLRKIRKDGSVMWVKEAARAVADSTGKMVVLVVCEDITAKRMAEKQLLLEQERLTTVLDGSPIPIVMIDRNHQVLYWNRACENLTGVSLETARGNTVADNLQEAMGENPDPVLADLMLDLSDEELIQRYGHKVHLAASGRALGMMSTLWPAGQRTVLEYVATRIHDPDGKVIGAIQCALDITEKEQLQKQLQISQKMEAIGTLAGGIAHDFNNLLTAINGFTELAMYKTDTDSPIHQDLQRIREAGLRARDLVAQILSYSRRNETKQQLVSIVVLVKEVLNLLRPSLPSTIEIYRNLDIEESRDMTLADPTQIHQVMMNLCTNAAQAMKEGQGILSVSVAAVEADTQLLFKCPELALGPYVCITVSDTGHGIDADVIEQIFDPYFTTKGPGEGSGLGLAVAQGIVAAHGGTIRVESEPGQGTVFMVYLPYVPSGEKEEEHHPRELFYGDERILFVDDEKSLVELGSTMLTALGYRVTSLQNSEEALSVFQQQPEAFDLVITDLTMPKPTGKDLAAIIHSIRSDIPIVLCTGFSELEDEEELRKSGIVAILLKPFTTLKLASTIRKLLDVVPSIP